MSIKPSDYALAYAAAFVPPPPVPRPQLLGRGVLSVGPDLPPAPQVGDLWWRTHTDAALYLWYDDGSSAQWVSAMPGLTSPQATTPRWIEFPNTPPPLTIGQQFVATNGVTYQWDGQVWAAISLPSPLVVPGDLDVHGNEHVGGDLTVDGNEHVRGNVQIDGTLTVAGVATFADLVVTDASPTFVVNSIDGAFLKDGTVSNAKISSVAWSKVTGAPTSFPPTGPAGGDLVGSSYPNPVVAPGAINNAKISDVAWGKITGAPAAFPPTGAAGGDLAGSSYPNPVVAPGAISRNKIAGGATNGALNFTAIPTGQEWGSGSALGWTTIITGTITTRGGIVIASVSSNLVGSGPPGGGNVFTRLWVDGARQATDTSYLMNSTSYVPIPGLVWPDNPAAGTHTYAYQIALDANCFAYTSTVAGGGMLLQEIG